MRAEVLWARADPVGVAVETERRVTKRAKAKKSGACQFQQHRRVREEVRTRQFRMAEDIGTSSGESAYTEEEVTEEEEGEGQTTEGM